MSTEENKLEGSIKEGAVIADRYRIVRLRGEGGMSCVYLTEDTSLRRNVALKLMSTAVSEDKELSERFVQEAQNAARIHHPGVVEIYEIGQIPGSARRFLVTEYVDGVTLSERLKGADRLSMTKACDLALQIAEALSAAHDVGVIHRDVKPANVILRPNGTIKLLDFGVSKLISPRRAELISEDVTPNAAAITRAGMMVGTPSYASPEQLRNEHADFRSDIFPSVYCSTK